MESKNTKKVDEKIITNTSQSPATQYLKKSELPINVSWFKNDVGYLTTPILEEWLKTHSYIKLSDLENIIKELNFEIYDDAFDNIKLNINSVKGEIDEIKTHFKHIISDDYKNYTVDDINNKINLGEEFFNGFYVINNGNSLIYIRDNKIIFKSNTQLQWEKDKGKDYKKHN